MQLYKVKVVLNCGSFICVMKVLLRFLCSQVRMDPQQSSEWIHEDQRLPLVPALYRSSWDSQLWHFWRYLRQSRISSLFECTHALMNHWCSSKQLKEEELRKSSQKIVAIKTPKTNLECNIWLSLLHIKHTHKKNFSLKRTALWSYSKPKATHTHVST